jgi:hypothetical protein
MVDALDFLPRFAALLWFAPLAVSMGLSRFAVTYTKYDATMGLVTVALLVWKIWTQKDWAS